MQGADRRFSDKKSSSLLKKEWASVFGRQGPEVRIFSPRPIKSKRYMNTGMRSDTASTAASTNLHDFSECNPFSASAGQTIQERATSAIHRLLNSQALPRGRRACRAQKLYRNDAFAKGMMLRIP